MVFRISRNLWRRIRKRQIGVVHVIFEDNIPLVKEKTSFFRRQIFSPPQVSILDFLNDSKRLVKDKRTKGLLLTIGEFGGNFATYQSLCDAIVIWKKAGIPVWVHSDSYSQFDYYLASFADSIYITAGGSIDTYGVRLTVNFYKEYLKTKGIETQVVHVSRYKSAFNRFALDEMPEEQRENLNWMVDTIYQDFVSTVATNRMVSQDEVNAMIDQSPLTDKNAQDGGWIDGIASPAQMADIIFEQLKKKVKVSIYPKVMKALTLERKRANIALIPVYGMIIDGKSREWGFPIPLIGGKQAGDQTINQMIRLVKRRRKYKAAVLLVDSPGGSATASESMLQELKQLAEKMPVIAYFHDVAASGGYYISMHTSRIVAQPLTVTASIGVINAKIAFEKFYEERQIKQYDISRGKHPYINSTRRLWDESETKKVEDYIFQIYDVFKGHVARNRGLTVEELEKITGGRVFMGSQAQEHGLVDEMGGIGVAIGLAAEEAGLVKPRTEMLTSPKASLPPTISDPQNFLIQELKQISGKNLMINPFELQFQL